MRWIILLAMLIAPGVAWSQTQVDHLSTTLIHQGKLRPQPYQSWLGRIKAPLPPGTIKLRFHCSGYRQVLGCMRWSRPYAIVGLNKRGRNLAVFSHEIGHVFDYYVLAPTGYRARFSRLDRRKWKTPVSEERFAEYYTTCALHRSLRRPIVTSGYRVYITPRRHQKACRLIRQAHRAWVRAYRASVCPTRDPLVESSHVIDPLADLVQPACTACPATVGFVCPRPSTPRPDPVVKDDAVTIDEPVSTDDSVAGVSPEPESLPAVDQLF